MVPVCVWIDPDEGRVTASGKNKNLAFFFWFKTKMLFSRQSYGSIIILACFVYWRLISAFSGSLWAVSCTDMFWYTAVLVVYAGIMYWHEPVPVLDSYKNTANRAVLLRLKRGGWEAGEALDQKKNWTKKKQTVGLLLGFLTPLGPHYPVWGQFNCNSK